MRRSPGFSAAVALILALGIGANTAMFSIVYGVLVRPLPYPDAGAIVRVGDSFGTRTLSAMLLSNRSMPLLQELSESFEQLAAYEEVSAEWDGAAGVVLPGARVSPSLFPLLRAAPLLGRLFLDEEARTGAERVALLSHGAWTRRFASDPAIVGATIGLDGDPHLVVGVLAEGFHFPTPDSEFWTPYVIPPFTQTSMREAPGQRTVFLNELAFSALGRLRPGVSPEQAATARQLFGAGPAVGQRVVARDEPWEIVGVVGDVQYGGLELTTESRPEAFFPLAQIHEEMSFGLGPARITVRTTGDPVALIPFLQEAVTATNPQATMDQVTTMEEHLSSAVAEPRLHAFFVGSLAGLTLVLAAFGVYGLLSYTVAQRRSEIAIRMALGAGRRQILALVVGQGAAIVAVGTLLGMGAAVASSRMLESLLYGIATDDRLTFLLAPFVLAAVALFACWLPARRATRVDPTRGLRVG
ncbi:MAG: ABC transporter permease [Acidobacteria bacterium]|nr:ABC transporter permease [Acidobacteriota bacterium]